MITITDFKIIDNGEKITFTFNNTDPESARSILLWDMNSFKDYSKAYNVTYKLEYLETEIVTVSADELNISSFSDMWFIEIITNPAENENFLTPALGITYNTLPYKLCMLDKYFKSQDVKKPCIGCESVVSDSVLSMSLILDTIDYTIDTGLYIQAIELFNNLKKLCSFKECTNCEKVECKTCSKSKII